MRFFLAGRDRVTGSVRLVSQSTFASRQDALDSLGMLLPADGSFDGLDLFVVDIEKSTPVVVYKPTVIEPLPGMPVDEPIADAWESPADLTPAEQALRVDSVVTDVTVVEDPYADAVIAELESVVAAPDLDMEPTAPEPMPLMEALRRAADRMEADGIVAPEPVGETAAPETIEWTEITPAVAEEVAAVEEVEAPIDEAAVEEPVAEAQLVEESAPEAPMAEPLIVDEQLAEEPVAEPVPEEPVADEPVQTPAAAQWPWEGGLSEPGAVSEIETPAVESDGLADLTAALGATAGPLLTDEDLLAPAAYAAAGVGEPASQVDSMLAAPVDEGFVPKPVIMGDYGAMVPGDVSVEAVYAPQEDESAVIDEVEPAVPEEPVEPMGSLLGDVERARGSSASAGPGSTEVPDDVPSDTPAEPVAAQPEPLDDLLAAIGEPAPTPAEPKMYSPGGLDMNAYTCEDCVYVGTCPKANEDSPATCGSFQWKSV